MKSCKIFKYPILLFMQGLYYKKMKESYDREVKNELGKKRYKVKGVDFWIGIYRPDKPFGTHMISGDEGVPIADIIIRNDSARDK